MRAIGTGRSFPDSVTRHAAELFWSADERARCLDHSTYMCVSPRLIPITTPPLADQYPAAAGCGGATDLVSMVSTSGQDRRSMFEYGAVEIKLG